MKTRKFKKLGMALVAMAFICVTLSSCHRHGCPNQITQVEQQAEKC